MNAWQEPLRGRETPIGILPGPEDLDTAGLNIPLRQLELLTAVDASGWRREVDDISRYYERFGTSLPVELVEQLKKLRERLSSEA